MGCGASSQDKNEAEMLRDSTPLFIELKLTQITCRDLKEGESIVFLCQLRYQRKRYALKSFTGTGTIVLPSEAMFKMTVNGLKIKKLIEIPISISVFAHSKSGADREIGKCDVPIEESWACSMKGSSVAWPINTSTGVPAGKLQMNVKVIYQEFLESDEGSVAESDGEDAKELAAIAKFSGALSRKDQDDCELLFKEWDTRGSGKLTPDEVFGAFTKLGHEEQLVNKFIKAMTSRENGDVISFHDFKSGFAYLKKNRKNNPSTPTSPMSPKSPISPKSPATSTPESPTPVDEPSDVVKEFQGPAVTEKSLNHAIRKIEEAFDTKTRTSVVNGFAKKYTLTSEQLELLVEAMRSDVEKMQTIDTLLPNISNPRNLEVAYSFVTTAADKADLVLAARTRRFGAEAAAAMAASTDMRRKNRHSIAIMENMDGPSAKAEFSALKAKDSISSPKTPHSTKSSSSPAAVAAASSPKTQSASPTPKATADAQIRDKRSATMGDGGNEPAVTVDSSDSRKDRRSRRISAAV